VLALSVSEIAIRVGVAVAARACAYVAERNGVVVLGKYEFHMPDLSVSRWSDQLFSRRHPRHPCLCPDRECCHECRSGEDA